MTSAEQITSPIPADSRVGFLGPLGTFTEQALLSQPDLAAAEIIPIDTIDEVLRSVDRGDVDYGFVAIENAIEGTVNLTLDTLAFDLDLRIQREVLLDIHMNLMAAPGTRLEDIDSILSIPVAVAQVRRFLNEQLPNVELKAANSTAEAAQTIAAEKPEGVAAVAPSLAAELYGLDVIAENIAARKSSAAWVGTGILAVGLIIFVMGEEEKISFGDRLSRREISSTNSKRSRHLFTPGLVAAKNLSAAFWFS